MAFVRVHSDDAGRILANLALYDDAIEYSVRSALRRGAQATVTQTRRRISKQTGVPQKEFKNQLRSYYRYREQEGPAFRAWMGKRRTINADRVPKLRKKALKEGAFYAPKLGKGLWKRKGEDRYPVERVNALDLNDYQNDMRRIGRTLGVRAYRQRLRRELSRRARKASNAASAKRLQRALAVLDKRLQTN